MYRKILVPFDDSDPSRNALKQALDMADGVEDPQVTILNVIEWHDYNAETFKIAAAMTQENGFIDAATFADIGAEAEMREIDRIGESISELIADYPYVDIAIVTGSPHETIVTYANELDYDVIVMGHRGLGVIRGMLGSVAFSVLQKTTKPVLVVK